MTKQAPPKLSNFLMLYLVFFIGIAVGVFVNDYFFSKEVIIKKEEPKVLFI